MKRLKQALKTFFVFLLFFSLSCHIGSISDEEVELEKKFITEYLNQKYPDDEFELKNRKSIISTFPQNKRLIVRKKNMRHGSYTVVSKKFKESFHLAFLWDEEWKKVNTSYDYYPYILLSKVAQNIIEPIMHEHPNYVFANASFKGKKTEDFLDEVTNLSEADAFLKNNGNVSLRYHLLMNADENTTREDLKPIVLKIMQQLNEIQDNNTVIDLTFRFYKPSQIDVSKIQVDLTESRSALNQIMEIEHKNNIDMADYEFVTVYWRKSNITKEKTLEKLLDKALQR